MLCQKIAARPAATRHLQRLLALKRDYPAQAFDSAIARGLQYGVYDLSRLEKLVLRVVAGDFFKLGNPKMSNLEELLERLRLSGLKRPCMKNCNRPSKPAVR